MYVLVYDLVCIDHSFFVPYGVVCCIVLFELEAKREREREEYEPFSSLRFVVRVVGRCKRRCNTVTTESTTQTTIFLATSSLVTWCMHHV